MLAANGSGFFVVLLFLFWFDFLTMIMILLMWQHYHKYLLFYWLFQRPFSKGNLSVYKPLSKLAFTSLIKKNSNSSVTQLKTGKIKKSTHKFHLRNWMLHIFQLYAHIPVSARLRLQILFFLKMHKLAALVHWAWSSSMRCSTLIYIQPVYLHCVPVKTPNNNIMV